MRLTVIGATGRTGTEVVRQALDAGHEVTAIARDPSRMRAQGAHVVSADIMDPDSLAPAIKDRDAVVSALGPRRGEPTGVLSGAARSTLAAMDAVGVRRLVVVSSSGFFAEEGDSLVTGKIVKPLLQRMLRDNATDTRQMETLVAASDTDWTITRPPRLTNRPRTGRYRTALDRQTGSSIARADLADAILKALGDPLPTIGHRVNVGY